MSGEQSTAEVREALEELQQYLSDFLPPLVVADSIQLLLRYSPELMAQNIHSWTASQYRGSTEIPVSDYLFHAVKKIHLMGEFKLVPQAPFELYLQELKEKIVAYCPESDREFLRENLTRLKESGPTSGPASHDAIFRQGPGGTGRTRSAAAARPGESSEELVGLRRLSVLLDRLEREVSAGGAGGSGGGRAAPLASATLAAAARTSQTGKEFEQYLERLREMGLNVNTGDVFKSLGSSLPGWVVPGISDEASRAALPASPAVEAMRRIVTETEDPAEGGRRFQELVRSAIDRFNEGSLAQAGTMIDLANQIIADRKIDPVAAQMIRKKDDDALDPDRLRKYAEAPDLHPQLRKVLNFFLALTPEGLLGDLRREVKRERRRLLLLLLEVHGATAREAALAELRPMFGRGTADEDWYFRRNLLYLLRRIPRPPGTPIDEDVDLAVRHTELRFPAPLVKEAIANLGQLKHEKAEHTLIALLQDLETVLLGKPDETPYDPREGRLLLDRVVAALARFGTPGARKAVIEHGLKRKPELGDTMARLAELAGQDLSGDGESLDRLLAAMKSSAPFKLFGLVLNPNDQGLFSCIEAISCTPAPAVRSALEELAKRFPNHEVGKAATKALASLAAPPAPAEPSASSSPSATLSGDLDIFGLPALLQSLAESRVTGSVLLRDRKGEIFGTIGLRTGKLKACQTGQLSGEEAFFQLFERPVPGTFLFSRLPDPAADDSGSAKLREILPLSLEGMRRYDELQQAAAILPDEVALKSTDVKPTAPREEKDGILLRDLWNRAAAGATPKDCEAAVKADSYRIRRLLVHWVSTGSLVAA
ncbi:MAG TPA: DUF4388 domain-containing protein [Thermoanaerobaculia bacterium]|nr:DUF4388 domain-containing protein [Thermoanaerobaculia bacterium]